MTIPPDTMPDATDLAEDNLSVTDGLRSLSYWLSKPPTEHEAFVATAPPQSIDVLPAATLRIAVAGPLSPGRWLVWIKDPSYLDESTADDPLGLVHGVASTTADTAELRRLLADGRERPRLVCPAIADHASLVWLVRNHVVVTHHPEPYQPEHPAGSALVTATAGALDTDDRFRRVSELPASDHPAVRAPKAVAGKRSMLAASHFPDSGMALRLADNSELLVHRDAGLVPWQVVFGSGRVPPRYTFGEGSRDVHGPSEVPEEITSRAGWFSDQTFASMLDRQWQVPEALAVDAGEEVLWLYRGWLVASQMPQDWTEHTQTRLDIALRLRDTLPERLDQLRSWRTQTSGIALKSGLAAAVRARTKARNEDLADEADWVRVGPPAPVPLAVVKHLPEGHEVTVGYDETGWSLTYIPGEVRLDEAMSDEQLSELFARMRWSPALLGFVDNEAIELYNGHLVSVRVIAPPEGSIPFWRETPDFDLDGTPGMGEALRVSIQLCPAVAEPVDAGDFEEVQRLLQPAAEFETQSPNRREHIPQRVRHEVWRRDEARCVECGSRERLEFDHIIPVSRGGSNTVRNLRLLCEACNREKAARI